VKAVIWGARGSVASPGRETARYGGNTSCVEVRGDDGTLLVLDAGTGIRRLGATLVPAPKRVDVLLSHLHLDHILGLGFFGPLHVPGLEVHIWGPASTTLDLRARLSRYLSPPLFPVHLRELECDLTLHEVPSPEVAIGEFTVSSALICHPDPTVGYRIASQSGTLAYLTDHEPALGVADFPESPEWTSGYAIAAGADVLIHDTQYSPPEYRDRVGWGHSALPDAIAFAKLAGVRELVTFHHDPGHSDDDIERLLADALAIAPSFRVTRGVEGAKLEVSALGRN
jgi:phosphoribosyl 1,2-cyclic phosphodiesterase